MQFAFDLGVGADLACIRDGLVERFGPATVGVRREPMAQLIKSLLGSRTKDAVSLAAFDRLALAYPGWSGLVTAHREEVQA